MNDNKAAASSSEAVGKPLDFVAPERALQKLKKLGVKDTALVQTAEENTACDVREGKVERLHQWLAARGQRLPEFREVWAYCDSMNDLPLMSIVTRPVAVNADPVLAAHARHQGWPVANFARERREET